MRIRHQSFSDLDRVPLYRATLARHAAAAIPPGDSVVLHGLREFLNETQVCEAALEAERQGYDAFAGLFLRSGVARHPLAGGHALRRPIRDIDAGSVSAGPPLRPGLAGVPMLDALGTLFHHAAFMAGLRSRLGTQVSRALHHAKPPPPMLAEARAAAGARPMDESEFSGRGTGP